MSKVRLGILGCGGFAGAHGRRMKVNPDVEIVALCDVREDIVEGYIQRCLDDYPQKPAIFTDAATMYQTAKPDAVVICTPHTLHFEHGMQALDHDCHVFMEKPMVTAAEDAYTLAQKVKQTGKIFVVGYNTPCTPEFVYLRELIRNGELGKLEIVNGYLSQGWLKATRGKWRQDPSLSGGGQAYDSGAHLLNSLCWSVESNISQVFAFIDQHGTEVDINSTINIRFENGVLASIAVSGNCPTDGSHMVFIFEGGRVDVDGWSGTWINVFKDKQRIKYPPIQGETCTPDENFIDAILGRAQPRTSPLNGIIQSELMDAIYESARTGQPASPRRGATVV